MTVPQALIALAIVTPIGLLGALLRHTVMRSFNRELTGWLGLASLLFFVVAATAYYWPNPTYFNINAALGCALLSSLLAFLSLGALTWGRRPDAPLMRGALFLFLALPLIAVSVFVLFIITWSGAHLNR
ncbi:MAG: hypothetical protein KF779_13480 [Hyphomonadaceae bacterium]|nr:hypothetical protein [Hyphomonadaceae bacterium]